MTSYTSGRTHQLRPFTFGLSILVATVLLSGCTTISRTSVETVRLALKRKPDVQPTAEGIAAVPYPQIKVNGPNGGAVLVLGNVDHDRQAWYSSDNRIVFLRDGLLVGTVGLDEDLRDVRIEGDNPFLTLNRLQTSATVQRRYDLMPGYRYGIPVTGTLERIGPETIDILGESLPLVHYREQLRGPGWNTSNDYWVEADTGFIWKSRQAIGPHASLEILQLKPYRPESPSR